eukprot:evm.model.scf_2332.3 EVM.evm.TU.scf_2332.3   scf_2332:16647-23687(-)
MAAIADREIDVCEGEEYVVKFGHGQEQADGVPRRRGMFRRMPTLNRTVSLAPVVDGAGAPPEGVVCEGGVCRRTGSAPLSSDLLSGKALGTPDVEAPLIQTAVGVPPVQRHYCSCSGLLFDQISWREFIAEFGSAEVQHGAIAEFLAMLMFNFLSCGTVATVSHPKLEGDSGPGPAADLLQIILIHVIILIVLIYTVAPLSGAHINPIVSVAFSATGLQSVPKGIAYVIAQVLGGICGSALLYAASPDTADPIKEAELVMGANAIPPDRTTMMGFTGEAVAAFILVFVIFGVAVDPRGWGKFAPVAVALTIGMLIFVVGPISSMCANPARALGAALISGYWANHWVFWTAPFLGALFAGWIYANLFLFRSEGGNVGPGTCPRTNTRVYVDHRRQAMLMASGVPAAPDLHIKAWIRGPPPNLLQSILVLEFFAVDCKPCRLTVPHLSALHKKYTRMHDGIAFVGIANDSEVEVREFVRMCAPEYFVALDNDGRTAHEYLDMLGVGTVPAVVVVGKSGQIRWHGHPTAPELEETIRGELNEIGVQLEG